MIYLTIILLWTDKNWTPMYCATDGKWRVEFSPNYMERHILYNYNSHDKELEKRLWLPDSIVLLWVCIPFYRWQMYVSDTKKENYTLQEVWQRIINAFT